MMEVHLLKEGVKEREIRDGVTYRNPVSSAITLLKTNVVVVVDTGARGDEQLIKDGLADVGVQAHDVEYVINTHWHFDHLSNNHLFPNAKYIIGGSTWPPRVNANKSTWDDEVESIEGVEIMRTPGHTPEHISVVAQSEGSVVIAGDAFYERDILSGINPRYTHDVKQFKQSALNIVQAADVIIPGHGPAIELTKKLREDLTRLITEGNKK